MSVDGLDIRDRRELPFFMVRVDALRAIREHLHGLRRARAIGAYLTLCAEANLQRAAGDHERLYLTQAELAHRLGAGRSSLREHLAALTAAGVIRPRRRYSEDGQPLPTELTLLTQSAPFVAMTVPALTHLERTIEPRARLGALGLYGTLLELCNEQRTIHGGACAESSRRRLAERLGVTVRSLDTYAAALAHAGLLDITRRPTGNGSHLPNVWELKEPTAATRTPSDRAEFVSALRQRRTDSAGQLGGKRPGPHTSGIRLHDAQHVVEHLRSDAAAWRRGAGETVRAGDVRIGPVVDVEQRTLRSFE